MFIVENDTFNLNMYDSISDFGILVVHIYSPRLCTSFRTHRKKMLVLQNWILQYLMVAL
jgi:hypothetical protein